MAPPSGQSMMRRRGHRCTHGSRLWWQSCQPAPWNYQLRGVTKRFREQGWDRPKDLVADACGNLTPYLKGKVQYLQPQLSTVLASCSRVTDPLYLQAQSIRLHVSSSSCAKVQAWFRTALHVAVHTTHGNTPAVPLLCANPAELVSNTCRLLSCRQAAGTCITPLAHCKFMSFPFQNSMWHCRRDDLFALDK